MLQKALEEGYAVGSFSARYLTNIGPVLEAAVRQNSPVIVQVSQKEMKRYGSTCGQFADEYRRCIREMDIRVPAALHLDHTKDLDITQAAIDAGFDSVMIDASEQPLEKNMEIVKKVVAMAHAKGVEVEAEIGKISANDLIETDSTTQLYTDPQEAGYFAKETAVDFLAVSVGTVHGAYGTRKPHIELERIREIREQVSVPLVLHGASGVPSHLIKAAISLEGGGVSKINVATDLETAFLSALGLDSSITNEAVLKLPSERLDKAHEAVTRVVEEKMRDFLLSSHRA